MGKEVSGQVKKFAADVRKKFGAEKVILFGSRARGDNLKDSDFDMIIVSRAFKTIPYTQRMSKILPLWKSRYDLEALCYTPEEFEEMKRKKYSVIEQAVEEGIAA